MAKIVVLLFVFLLCNVSALPINSVDEFKTKLEKVRDEAIDSVNTLNLDNVETRRAIVSHSSEFAHRLQETINTIFRIFVRIDERYSHRILPQVALHLNDMVHEIQEVLISKPTVLRRTLKENVNKVSEEITKLMEVLQHITDNRDVGRLRQDVEQIIEKLIDAIHQLRIRSDVQRQSNDVIGQSHRNLGIDIVEALNKITWSDSNTYSSLVNIAQNFDHTLNHILYHFQKEIFHFGINGRDNFSGIVKRMQEIRSQLQAALLKDDNTNTNRKIEDLTTQLSLTVHNFDVEIQRLTKISDSLNGNRTLIVGNCIKNVLADSFNGEQRLLWKLQEILRNHHVFNSI